MAWRGAARRGSFQTNKWQSMNGDKLDGISEKAAASLRDLISEESARIVADYAAASKEAALQGKKFKFPLRFQIVLADLTIKTRLAWGTSCRREQEGPLEDPDQGTLEFAAGGAGSGDSDGSLAEERPAEPGTAPAPSVRKRGRPRKVKEGEAVL
jgi:hypothetical protein